MKKNKSFLAVLCALVLTVTMAFGGFTLMPAFAAEGDNQLNITLENVQTTVYYGKTFKVKSVTGVDSTTVTAPDGSTVNFTAETVTANQLGNYTVTYKKGTAEYSYRVYCSLENELELRVLNEALVPSYVKTGTTKKLPDAQVGFYDEDGKWNKVNATITRTTNTGATVDADGNFTFSNAGSVFVVYGAKVEGGSKFMSKSFEIKVQDDFEDTKAPTINVSGVPSTGNVNRAVTLPVATVSDSFDERPEVIVKVEGRNAEGVLAEVNKVEEKDGVVTELTEKEVFDNNKNMTFTPVRSGDYKVTYKAVDDNGNETAEWTYTVTVSDKRAPEITVDETKIPAKWGYNKVTKLESNSATANEVDITGDDLNVTFPFPEVKDNLTEAKDVKIGFTVRDPENNTVVSFSNINGAKDASGTVYTSSIVKEGETGSETNKKYAFDNTMKESGFSLNFGEYIGARKKDTSNPNYVSEGDYVVTYSAEDAAGNHATKTITINVTESFTENSVITLEFNNLDKYVVGNENKSVDFTVPTPTYSSTTDAKLTLEYSLKSGEKSIEVKGGEKGKIAKVDTAFVLTVDDEELAIENNKIELIAKATSDAGNFEEVTKEIKFIAPDTTALFDAAAVNTDGLAATVTSTANNHNLGNVTIPVTEGEAKNVGVEVGIKNAKGEYVSDMSAEVYNVGNAKYVRNISFNTSVTGDYFVEVRVFDIKGNSKVIVKSFNIAGNGGSSDGNLDATSSVTNNTTAEVNAKFLLANETINVNGALAFVDEADKGNVTASLVRKVQGGRFSLMGEEFTALSTGRYTISESVELYDGTTKYDAGSQADELEAYLKGIAPTPGVVSVSDTAAVKFELLAAMPSYSALNTDVELPKATAFTENGNGEVTVDVKSPTGETVILSDVVDGENMFKSFEATANGTYKVTYTVKINGKESTFPYDIKAGDVELPKFELTDANGNAASHVTSVKSGYKFDFLYIHATDNRTAPGQLTYSKRVVGPDGEVVGSAITGTGTTYANRVNPTSGQFTLDASGKYTVIYTVTDEAGNVSTKEFEITVTNTTGNSGISLAALSTILIVVGVLLIAGVVVYLFRFRRVKKD